MKNMKRFIALLGLCLAFVALSDANARVDVGIGIGGVVAPAPVVVAPPPCRQFRQDVVIGNRIRSTYGTACLQPDGSWAVVNPPAYIVPGPTVNYVAAAPVIEGAVIIGRPGWYHGRFWDGHHWR